MTEHVKQWLNAYLDGELRGARMGQVESHLTECAECRAELDDLRGLFTLLRETSPAGEFISTERFVSNLTLSLPRQPEHSQPRRVLEIGW
jgi:anti-sigma factor RsiW